MKDVLASLGLTMEDLNLGFSFELDSKSGYLTIRPDKVIQLLTNNKEGNACGGYLALNQLVNSTGNLTSSGPNECLLVIALLCVIFMKNKYLLKLLEFVRYALGFDRLMI